MSVDPETLARGRFRPLAKMLNQRDKIQAETAKPRARSGELRASVPGAESRDRVLRGRAAAEGKPRPQQLEAAQIAAEWAEAQEQVKDLEAAALEVEHDLQELRLENRVAWSGRQARKVEQAKAAVFDAVRRLRATVATLEDETGLLAWVDAATAEGSFDPLGGRVTHAGALTAALEQLVAAATGIAAGEHQPAPAPPRELNRVEKFLAVGAKVRWGG